LLIDLEKEFKKYNIFPKGFIQVGAHIGQEVKIFKNLNNEAKIYLFEPQKELFQKLKIKYENDEYVSLYNLALGNSKQKQTMYKDINNDSQSSSILEPKEHLKYHSYIEFEKDHKEIIYVDTLDSFNIDNANILCIDVQGYELNVLKGSKKSLNNVEALVVEINRKELYEGCPHVSEIDNFLKDFNYVRIVTKWWRKTIPWGDALYIKKNKITLLKLALTHIYNFMNQKSITFYILSRFTYFKK
jgi:FkbM family methyltransferase|tara:strand:- start:384 stop:1115 length:732 start_codon:yes stop_codon:yes gene_type:complete